MDDHVNPELRRRLEARREEEAVLARARQPYRSRGRDTRFWVIFYVVMFIAFAILGNLVD
ncbi:hypothetical protein [Streptomyces sp. NPDC047315]|uniref:hypothetical protein n=1 Tax=Streptomyces sp. NPDC047315 TaxID=3155142 RepID=UPI0033CA1715